MARQDADDDFLASRHGGDEFLVALELKRPEDIERVAPRLKHDVDDPARQRERGYVAPVRLSASMGGIVYELPDTPPPIGAEHVIRELVTAADEQMYEAKRDGLVHIAAARYRDTLEINREHAWVLS